MKPDDKIKIRVYSDIHLDWYTTYVEKKGEDAFWYPPELPDDKETILCLSGDLWIGTRWIEWGEFSWIGKVAPRFKQVLVVLGNHDYWPQGDLTIQNGGDKCNAMLQDRGFYNVKVLDCDTFMVDNFMFIGATLWTDMKRSDPLIMQRMAGYMNYDGKISFSTGDNGAWERYTSARWVQTHDKHKRYIELVAKQNLDKKIIVLTHHVPLPKLCDPRYNYNDSDYYYQSDLSDLILDNENIVAWCYGHTHYQKETAFPSYAEQSCLMINNAVGYTDEAAEEDGLVKHKVIELC